MANTLDPMDLKQIITLHLARIIHRPCFIQQNFIDRQLYVGITSK